MIIETSCQRCKKIFETDPDDPNIICRPCFEEIIEFITSPQKILEWRNRKKCEQKEETAEGLELQKGLFETSEKNTGGEWQDGTVKDADGGSKCAMQ